MATELIKRPRYLRQIRPFMGKSLIKVLTGQRCVGKSYLLLQLIGEIRQSDAAAPTIYINRENLACSHLQNAADLANFVAAKKVTGRRNYVFIDEIQEISDFPAALRSLLLDEELDLYCTGSNGQLLSSDITGALSGRAVAITVHSLSYREFLKFTGREDGAAALEQYLKYGGLPFLRELPWEDHVIFEYLRNIYSTIAIRDVVNRYNLRNPQFLEQMAQFFADNIGSLFSAKKIADFLKAQRIATSVAQVQNYAAHLANAFLIHRMPRYDIVGKRLFEIGEKYYFTDLGLRNALIGYRPQDRGKLLENTVFNHLQMAGFSVKTGGLNRQEIDFVAEKAGERIYVQVALTINEEKTLEREFGNLLQIADNYPKYLVTMDEFTGNSYAGVRCLGVRQFIDELLPAEI